MGRQKNTPSTECYACVVHCDRAGTIRLIKIRKTTIINISSVCAATRRDGPKMNMRDRAHQPPMSIACPLNRVSVDNKTHNIRSHKSPSVFAHLIDKYYESYNSHRSAPMRLSDRLVSQTTARLITVVRV